MAVTMPGAQVATIVMQTRNLAYDVLEEACDVFYSYTESSTALRLRSSPGNVLHTFLKLGQSMPLPATSRPQIQEVGRKGKDR